MLQPNKTTLEGVRQQSAATFTLPAATKKTAPRSAFSRLSVAAEATSAAVGAREGKCDVSLPEGVEQLVAGAACSLLLQTNPPSHAKLDWEVSLLSYSDETQQHSGGRRPHECVGFPVAFVLGTSSGGVQSCSFVATRAGVIVCRARARGRTMEPCSFSVDVVASQPCAFTSRMHLVHPLPSVDVVAVGQDVSLRLLVPAATRCFSIFPRTCCDTAALLWQQVNTRDAFGNRCPMPGVRCKLVCSSSDGSHAFVEACGAEVVSPFAHAHLRPAALQSILECSPNQALSSVAPGEALQSKSFCPLASASDNESSAVGDIDVGRCC
jgi:hypothetical protein